MTQFQTTQNRTTPNPLPGFLRTIAFRAANAKRRVVLRSFRKSNHKPCSHWTLTKKVRGRKKNKLKGGAKMQRSSCLSFRTLSGVESRESAFRSLMHTDAYEAGYLLSNQAFRQSRRYIPSKTGLLRLFSRTFGLYRGGAKCRKGSKLNSSQLTALESSPLPGRRYIPSENGLPRLFSRTFGLSDFTRGALLSGRRRTKAKPWQRTSFAWASRLHLNPSISMRVKVVK
jgi:hypothetical protein